MSKHYPLYEAMQTRCQVYDQCWYNRNDYRIDQRRSELNETFVIHGYDGHDLGAMGFAVYDDQEGPHERTLCDLCATSMTSEGSCAVCKKNLYNAHLKYDDKLYCGFCIDHIFDRDLYDQLEYDTKRAVDRGELELRVLNAIAEGDDPWYTDIVLKSPNDRVILRKMMRKAIHRAMEVYSSTQAEEKRALQQAVRRLATLLGVEEHEADGILRSVNLVCDDIPEHAWASRTAMMTWALGFGAQ